MQRRIVGVGMGVEIELHSERPARHGKKSRVTLIRGSYQHGEALAHVLDIVRSAGGGRLAQVDPYGDTLWNEQEAEVVIEEASRLLRQCTQDAQRAAVEDLVVLLRLCARISGSYLWFMGD
jgi:hypothetical protein